MAAEDPGASPRTHRAHEAEPQPAYVTRMDDSQPQPQAQPFPQTQPYPQAQAAYPQQGIYGWGTQVPLPSPRPKVSLPRRTVVIASALVAAVVLALTIGVLIAQPSGGSAAK